MKNPVILSHDAEIELRHPYAVKDYLTKDERTVDEPLGILWAYQSVRHDKVRAVFLEDDMVICRSAYLDEYCKSKSKQP